MHEISLKNSMENSIDFSMVNFLQLNRALQDGLKRSPALQRMTVGTPFWHWMKVAQDGSSGLGTAPDKPPAHGMLVGPEQGCKKRNSFLLFVVVLNT